jgi:hypothetical protein
MERETEPPRSKALVLEVRGVEEDEKSREERSVGRVRAEDGLWCNAEEGRDKASLGERETANTVRRRRSFMMAEEEEEKEEEEKEEEEGVWREKEGVLLLKGIGVSSVGNATKNKCQPASFPQSCRQRVKGWLCSSQIHILHWAGRKHRGHEKVESRKSSGT